MLKLHIWVFPEIVVSLLATTDSIYTSFRHAFRSRPRERERKSERERGILCQSEIITETTVFRSTNQMKFISLQFSCVCCISLDQFRRKLALWSRMNGEESMMTGSQRSVGDIVELNEQRTRKQTKKKEKKLKRMSDETIQASANNFFLRISWLSTISLYFYYINIICGNHQFANEFLKFDGNTHINNTETHRTSEIGWLSVNCW